MVRLAEFYKKKFLTNNLVTLCFALELSIDDMWNEEMFHEEKDLSELLVSFLLVAAENITYELVYLLLRLNIDSFCGNRKYGKSISSMTIVKNKLWNSVGD